MERFLSDWSKLVSESTFLAQKLPSGAKPEDECVSASPEVVPLVHAGLKLVRRHLMGIVSDALGDSPISKVIKEDDNALSPNMVAMEVVRHAVSLVDVFVAQFPGLPRERLVISYLGTVRGCLGTGYNRSWEALESLGLTATPEVRDAVEKTRELIRRMLTLYEHHKRNELAREWPELSKKRVARRR